MDVQIGIDLVEVAEIEQSLALHGDRFLDRVFTPAERARARGNPRLLASGFAAKEATMKALGRADEAVEWRSIEALGDRGDPQITLHGEAARIADARSVTALSATVSADRARAIAIVVAEAT